MAGQKLSYCLAIRRVPVRVVKVKKDVVVINFNHPLAGKTLNFDVEESEIK